MVYIFNNRDRRTPIREMKPVVNSNSNLSTPFENVNPNLGMANPMGGFANYNPNIPGVSTPTSPLRKIGGFGASSTAPGGGAPWSMGQGASAVPERSFRGTSGQALSPFANVTYQAPFGQNNDQGRIPQAVY